MIRMVLMMMVVKMDGRGAADGYADDADGNGGHGNGGGDGKGVVLVMVVVVVVVILKEVSVVMMVAG